MTGAPPLHHHRPDACLVCELPGLVVDLTGELTGGAEHQRQRVWPVHSTIGLSVLCNGLNNMVLPLLSEDSYYKRP